MNDRYRILAHQATNWCANNAKGTQVSWEEKFAELIVEECAQVCWSVSELEYKGYTVSECAKRIHKHFGVKDV